MSLNSNPIMKNIAASDRKLDFTIAADILLKIRERKVLLSSILPISDDAWHIMLWLYLNCRESTYSQVHIARQLNLSEVVISRWLDRFVKAGLAIKAECANDGRRTLVRLSGLGLRNMEEILDVEAGDIPAAPRRHRNRAKA
jgi:DNA-binding MarR family transcriptional regulator